MSLAIAFCTTHGIVMSADRCITTTLKDGTSFCSTMTERKLFQLPAGHAFSYTGDSTFRNRPASYWMEFFIDTFGGLNMGVADFTLKLCNEFHNLEPTKNIVIIGAGYENGAPHVFSSNSKDQTLVDHLDAADACIAFSGETDLARAVIDAKPLVLEAFTIPDAVDFVKHVTLTVSNIQRFAQTPVTVSPDCDVLIIEADRTRWINAPLLT